MARYSPAEREKQRARMRMWVARYRSSERGRKTWQAWYQRTRPERLAAMRQAHQRRQARLAATVRLPYTLHDVVALYVAYDEYCAYCGDVATTLDHIIPLARGGHDALYNLAPACRPCNCSKSDKMLDEWYSSQSFFSVERMDFIFRVQTGTSPSWA